MTSRYSRRSGWREFIYAHETVFKVVGVVLLLTVLIFLIAYRSPKTIVIESRYWTYRVDVGHTHETTTVVCRPRSGSSSGMSCSTQTSNSWRTKCTQVERGEVLPPVRPELKCNDEEERETITYHVGYHEEDEPRSRTVRFNSNLWTDLAPGSVVSVKMTVLGTITEITDKAR